jgi:hydroxyisourate hydrolase
MLSTHVLDTARGKPAAGIVVTLLRVVGNESVPIRAAITNADGRTEPALATVDLTPGIYEVAFAVAPYFERHNIEAFYDTINVRFRVSSGVQKYHVPLLLSPWGYSTYRGS